jgi:hypothetical protein
METLLVEGGDEVDLLFEEMATGPKPVSAVPPSEPAGEGGGDDSDDDDDESLTKTVEQRLTRMMEMTTVCFATLERVRSLC